MGRWLIGVAGIVVAGVLATGAGAQVAPAGCAVPTTSGSSVVSVTSGAVPRTAVVHVPTSRSGELLPVLFAMHGAAQSGTFFEGYTGFSALADSQHFIAVYPNALPTVRFGGRPFWNIDDTEPTQPDDVRFVSDLLTQLESSLCVDATRVFATGVSNGGGMTARLGCELSDRITAIAPVAGGYKALPACHPTHRVAVLEVHGTSDAAVPYTGVRGTGAGAAMPFVAAWAAVDGCAPTPLQTTPAPRVLRLGYTGCAGGTTVAHLRIAGGGHQLPGGLPPDAGQPASIDVPWEIWRFFRAHGRRVG